MKNVMYEKVIFRTEWNKYENKTTFIAVFPDDESNYGNVCMIPFSIENDTVTFEAFGEMSMEYYYQYTKLVKKNSNEAKKCLKVLTEHLNRIPNYNPVFRVMEKIMR